MFWKRWLKQYLQSLQERRKWFSVQTNAKKPGDVILLKDKELPQTEWCVGVVENAMANEDGKVRKAEIRVSKNRKCVRYTRPVTEMVILLKRLL